MVEQPNFVLRRAGWLGSNARKALEGATYCPACARLVYRMWIPRMLRVGKVGVKVGLNRPLGARLMLQDLAHLAL